MQKLSNFNCYTKAIALTSFLLFSNISEAKSLRHILQYALNNDPILLEANADLQAADNRIGQSKAMHYPTVRLLGNQLIAQNHKKKSDYSDKKFTPALEAKVNVYSFGAINAEIDKNKASKRYYTSKYNISREQLGYTIGELYVAALNAKNAISVLEKSLKRHNRFANEVRSIVYLDKGRESELVQVQARTIMVEQKINDQRRVLETTLKTLSKYYNRLVTEKDLSSPFEKLSKKKLVSEYTLKDKTANPNYVAQQAELESKIFDVKAEKAKRLPSLNLLAAADRDNQQVMLQFSWDLFNQATAYSIKEKEHLKGAANSRLSRIERDVEEEARLALINIQRSQKQLKILNRQIKANMRVAEIYKSQFRVAKKSLLDVLNAETDLSDVALAYTNTEKDYNKAILDYLHSQGQITNWVQLNTKLF